MDQTALIMDEAAEVPTTSVDNHPLMPILSQLVDILADGLDHPEVWAMLATIGDAELIDLCALIVTLLPFQDNNGVNRSFQVLAGVIQTIIVDQRQGFAALKQLETVFGLCPQVAGAIFFADRYGDPDRTADLTGRFCPAPFSKFETLMDGTVAPCCSIWTQQRLGNFDRQNASEIWNSVDAQAMRASILDGSFRYCNKQRCTMINEDKLQRNEEVEEPRFKRAIAEQLTDLDFGPEWVGLAHDVTCNLACPSCRDGMEVADEAQQKRFDKIEMEVVRPILDGEEKKIISLSGQGDPWSSPHYRSILRYLADNERNVKLYIHSNALLMSEKRWNQYLGLEKYRPLVDISIDAASAAVYEVVRRPGKWSVLLPNLRFLSAKRQAGVFELLEMNATIQLDNYHEIPALIALAEELKIDQLLLYMMQNTGTHLAKHYKHRNVGDAEHPLHLAFLETLRDPSLARPVVHMYDVATWRSHSFGVVLPADELGPDYIRDAMLDAVNAAIASEQWSRTVALAVAARRRWPDDTMWLELEARALDVMGFPQQAGFRRAMLPEALAA